MNVSEAKRVLIEGWWDLGQSSLEEAVETLIDAKGGEKWIRGRSHFFNYPRQLAVHELDRPEVRQCVYPAGSFRLFLDYSRILEICEDEVPTTQIAPQETSKDDLKRALDAMDPVVRSLHVRHWPSNASSSDQDCNDKNQRH